MAACANRKQFRKVKMIFQALPMNSYQKYQHSIWTYTICNVVNKQLMGVKPLVCALLICMYIFRLYTPLYKMCRTSNVYMSYRLRVQHQIFIVRSFPHLHHFSCLLDSKSGSSFVAVILTTIQGSWLSDLAYISKVQNTFTYKEAQGIMSRKKPFFF